MMHIKKIKVPTYGGPMWIVVSKNISSAIDKIEDIIYDSVHMENRQYRSYTFANDDNRGRYRIIIFIRPQSPPGEIAHECKHAVNLIFSSKGVKLSLCNDEHECYYLERIIDFAHRAISEYRKKYGPKKQNTIT